MTESRNKPEDSRWSDLRRDERLWEAGRLVLAVLKCFEYDIPLISNLELEEIRETLTGLASFEASHIQEELVEAIFVGEPILGLQQVYTLLIHELSDAREHEERLLASER